jgi:hypothetical protein
LVESQTISLSVKKRLIEVVDFREEPEPLSRLNQIQNEEQLIVWGEFNPQSGIKCLDRFSLYPSDVLGIWTIPPGSNEIQAVLQKGYSHKSS